MKLKYGILLFAALWLWHSSVSAQRLVIGQRPADLKIQEYILGEAIQDGQPLLIEFFYSPSQHGRDHLPLLNEMAKAYQGQVTVLLLARESREKIEPWVLDKDYVFTVALDEEGKTFEAFEVQYVPFSVLLDAKGRVRWFGHSTQLSIPMIRSALEENL